MNPVLYLDVDGVLAPLRHGTPRSYPESWGDWKWHHVAGFDLLLSQRMADAIMLLDCEIRWSTTWSHAANIVGSVFGWPEHHVTTVDQNGHHVPWKVSSMGREMLDEPERAYIIIDDHVGNSSELTDWVRVHGTGMNIFRVWPKSRDGITEEHIEHIHRFIAEL